MERITPEQFEMPNINVGGTILNDLKEDGRSVEWLSKKIDLRLAGVYYQLNTNDFDIDFLWKVSVVMKHNYLAEYSKELGKDITRKSRETLKTGHSESLKTYKSNPI